MKTFVIALTALACLPTAHAQTPLSVRGLVRQADFVGIIQAEPPPSAAQGEWRQNVFLTSVEGIKGGFALGHGKRQYRNVQADHIGVAGYPTRLGEGGEYLVFLHKTVDGQAERWTTLATFRVQYYPYGLSSMFSMAGGGMVGLLAGGQALAPPPARPVVSIAEARQWLSCLALGRPLARRDEARMDAFLHASLLSAGDAQGRATPTHEERMALAQKLAAAVTVGTTRAEVEKIFPQSDGGAFGSSLQRYYFGAEVMVDVPYDTSGGPFQPENRVNGPCAFTATACTMIDRKRLVLKALAISLLLCGTMAGAQVPEVGAPRSVPAPSWHTGQAWSVREPLLEAGPQSQGGPEVATRDSPTAFTTYKFQVLGRRTLRYEEQDGSAHIGQVVPPEDCWLVSVTPSLQSRAFDGTSYHLYFRADDLSLREIHLILRNGRGGYFMYAGTRVNNDDEAKAGLVVDRGPYCNSLDMFLMDWPHFPLTIGSDGAGKKMLLHEAITQTGAPEGAGIRVVLQTGRETATQTWLPGDPWWRFAERDGLRKSRLVVGEQRPPHQVE